jgi:Rps23 Pro-64 3,4-dihydroxylase Tpa1-like proline 4-hydroxylase
MKNRTAAIIIDNFLSDDKWNYIKNEVFNSNYIKCIHPTREKNDLWNFISQSLKERLIELNIWENNWDKDLLPGSYINVTTPSIDVELCDNGYHQDDTGFAYYIHPSWNSEWKGALKFKDCLIGEVVPVPNRFVWINENIWHGIGMFNELAHHNRIAVVGWSWPHKNVESVDCDYTINTLVGNC